MSNKEIKTEVPEYETVYRNLWKEAVDADYEDFYGKMKAFREYGQYIAKEHGSYELRRLNDKYGD